MIKHFGCLIVLHACQESRIPHLYLQVAFFAFADDMVSWSKMI